MATIPEPQFDIKDLELWFKMHEELTALKASESLLRQKIFKACFPEPKENTNKFALPDGYVLNGKLSITRKLDVDAFTALKDEFIKAGFDPYSLIKNVPELVLSQYRTLTAEQKSVFDQALTIKPGSVSLEVVKPKSKE
jgi:hypothetical protein